MCVNSKLLKPFGTQFHHFQNAFVRKLLRLKIATEYEIAFILLYTNISIFLSS